MKNLLFRLLRKSLFPIVPKSRVLAFRYWLRILDGSCEHELLNLQRLTRSHDVAIDIGANEGIYSYKMSKHFAKVWAFEINEELTKDLSAYNPGNIHIVDKGLSSKKEDATLYIPVLRGVKLTGWASLAPDNCPATKEHIERRVSILPLDDFNLTPVSFIKIDVEGHEVEVLKGALKTLTTNRPTVLIEIKERNLSQVSSLFASINYKEKKLADVLGKAGDPENHFFVPMIED